MYPEETIQILAYVVVFLAGIHDGKVTCFLLIRAISLLKGADPTATEEQVEENSNAGAGGESTSEMPNEVQVEEDMNMDENEVLEATGESPVGPPVLLIVKNSRRLPQPIQKLPLREMKKKLMLLLYLLKP